MHTKRWESPDALHSTVSHTLSSKRKLWAAVQSDRCSLDAAEMRRGRGGNGRGKGGGRQRSGAIGQLSRLRAGSTNLTCRLQDAATRSWPCASSPVACKCGPKAATWASYVASKEARLHSGERSESGGRGSRGGAGGREFSSPVVDSRSMVDSRSRVRAQGAERG